MTHLINKFTKRLYLLAIVLVLAVGKFKYNNNYIMFYADICVKVFRCEVAIISYKTCDGYSYVLLKDSDIPCSEISDVCIELYLQGYEEIVYSYLKPNGSKQYYQYKPTLI